MVTPGPRDGGGGRHAVPVGVVVAVIILSARSCVGCRRMSPRNGVGCAQETALDVTVLLDVLN